MNKPDGKRITSLRNDLGWTQEQLAEAAGLSVRTIRNAERGNSASRETLMSIAAALDLPHHKNITMGIQEEKSTYPTSFSVGPQPENRKVNEARKLSRLMSFVKHRATLPFLALVSFAIFLSLIAHMNGQHELEMELFFAGIVASFVFGIAKFILWKKSEQIISSLTYEDKQFIAKKLASLAESEPANLYVPTDTLDALRRHSVATLSQYNTDNAKTAISIALGFSFDHPSWRSIEEWEGDVKICILLNRESQEKAGDLGLSNFQSQVVLP
ncbi:MAG: helix-turn-helix transcriptional regulator [Planctomycetes bacterium]|nr:helix-turn-helix transcriptional regulator [Planctomycetota bacterium]